MRPTPWKGWSEGSTGPTKAATDCQITISVSFRGDYDEGNENFQIWTDPDLCRQMLPDVPERKRMEGADQRRHHHTDHFLGDRGEYLRGGAGHQKRRLRPGVRLLSGWASSIPSSPSAGSGPSSSGNTAPVCTSPPI